MKENSSRLIVDSGWLVEEVDEHTCGTDPSGHYGQHEPGCGLIPAVQLDTLPGWPGLPDRDQIAETVKGVIEAHKYERYGDCACGLDLDADWGKYKVAWRQHLQDKITDALLKAQQ